MLSLLKYEHEKYGKIFVHEYQTSILIGILEHEKINKQNIIISVEILCPLKFFMPKNDNINEVFNYDVIVQIIEKRTINCIYNLQETLCDIILQDLYEYNSVSAVAVRVHKTNAYDKCKIVGVQRLKYKLL